MKIHLTLNGAPSRVEIQSPAPACRFRIGQDPPREAHVELAGHGVYSVLMDGRCYDAHVEETVAGLVITIDGYRFEAEVVDPRRWNRRASGHGGKGAQVVTAPMPGKVVRVLVSAGDEIAAGQGIAVVEAMKMQNELKATRAGRVATVSAREGATVTAGEVLATIE